MIARDSSGNSTLRRVETECSERYIWAFKLPYARQIDVRPRIKVIRAYGHIVDVIEGVSVDSKGWGFVLELAR